MSPNSRDKILGAALAVAGFVFAKHPAPTAEPSTEARLEARRTEAEPPWPVADVSAPTPGPTAPAAEAVTTKPEREKPREERAVPHAPHPGPVKPGSPRPKPTPPRPGTPPPGVAL
jgi:hypothetical protein